MFLLMIRGPPRSTRTDTLFPYTTLFRSQCDGPDHPSQAGLGPSALVEAGPLGDAAAMRTEHVDVLLVGAGISGVGAAWHLQDQRPCTRFVILEAMESFGGPLLLHRYPGIPPARHLSPTPDNRRLGTPCAHPSQSM